MRFTLHLTQGQRVLLEQGAAATGKTLNDFLLDSAGAAAEKALQARGLRSALSTQYQLGLEQEEVPDAVDQALEELHRRTLWDEPERK